MPSLQEARNLIVQRWSEMSGYWGINRTMAEIHALLFVTRKPLCTDDVMEQLKISRGNASINLRALVDWGLISRVHRFGERKEYFQADADIWRMCETILRERSRREVEPIRATLDRCVQMVSGPASATDDPEDVAVFRERVKSMRDFLHAMAELAEAVLRFGADGLASLTGQLSAQEPAPESHADDEPRRTRRRAATNGPARR